jgi:hypothetical protein
MQEKQRSPGKLPAHLAGIRSKLINDCLIPIGHRIAHFNLPFEVCNFYIFYQYYQNFTP